jgi:hypothetical protein
VLALVTLPAFACADIRSNTMVTIVPRPGAADRVIGSPSGRIAGRGLTATWRQELDVLDVELVELRSCKTVVHEPVVRVERTTRRAGPGLAVEWVLGVGLTSLGIAGIARPEMLSNSHVNSEGRIEKDLESGYRLAGIALGIGVIALTSSIIDSVRARDEVHYADAYRVRDGGAVPCNEPRVPLAREDVVLIVGDHRSTVITDQHGRARFVLPPEPTTKDGVREIHRGVLSFEDSRAVAVDFVVPYARALHPPHVGEVTLAPE